MDTDTVQRPKVYATLEAFWASLTDDKRQEYRASIRERLGFDPAQEWSRGIGVADVARLAGVEIGTSTQWRRRTMTGKLRKAFLDPKPDSPTGKPLFDPMMVAAWLDWTNRWPPTSAARPETTRAHAA